MFQFTTFPLIYYLFHIPVTELSSAGFPHSDICGSSDICSLPQLFAAYHVLLRLLVPRHPPYALLRLINSSCQHELFMPSSQTSLFEVILVLAEVSFPTSFFLKLFFASEFFILPTFLFLGSPSCNPLHEFFFVRYAFFKVQTMPINYRQWR